MLKFEDVHIGFSKTKGSLRRLLFKSGVIQFNSGEFIAVIGPNGSGKTTFFNTLLGLQEPLEGKISFEGTNWNDVDRKEKTKILSFVPSKFLGVNHLTIQDLIAMGRAPYTNILNQLTEKDHEIIDKVVQQLGLTPLLQENTLNLSDGERQTAMIGKALAQEASIMILDEPTAFLDYNNRRKVLELLSGISKENNQLTLISSHDLDLCFHYCSRVIAIDIENNQLLDFKTPFNKKEIIQKVFNS